MSSLATLLVLGIMSNAAAAPDAASTPIAKPDYYIACGCGCCGGWEEMTDGPPPQCVKDHDELEAVIAKDKAIAENTAACATMGCSIGQRYEICE